jgi:CRP-like cAMP-binding protein
MARFKSTGAPEDHDSLQTLRKTFEMDDVIFFEGDLGLNMYVIERGEVEIRKRVGNGEESVLAVLGKGDFFGEMCMLEDDVPRSATAVARSDVTTVEIDQSGFTTILKHNPEIAVRMMRKLVRRLRTTTRMLEEALGREIDIDQSGVTEGPRAAPDLKVRFVETETGRIFPLAIQRETFIGRIDPVTGIHPDIDLTPVDTKRTISRRHARVRREDDGSFSLIEDVGTMNGTFVNNVRLTAGRPYPLHPGDSVLFGTVHCSFEVDPTERG